VAAGVICFFSSTTVKRAFGYDDSLDAFGVHCIGGIVGALLTGALVSKEISGATGSVLLQLKGVTATLVWSFVMSLIILKLIDLTIGLRVTSDEEREGLDITQHGESIE
jgi:ammonium transporter, Amt family